MKKILYLSLATLMVLVVSCKKDQSSTPSGWDGVTPMPEAVDLGFPSGLKWASFNLGAGKPEEYGDYYAWGEIAPQESYSWSTYVYATGASSRLTKYCPEEKDNFWDATARPEGPDGEVILLPSDDVAHVKLGGKWRMPTEDDFNELLALMTNDDYTWEKWVSVTNDNGDEVHGLRITRKSTGATLFLPAAGLRGNGEFLRYDVYGYFWSSSVNAASPYFAKLIFFNSSDADLTNYDRSYGLSIRPVCKD